MKGKQGPVRPSHHDEQQFLNALEQEGGVDSGQDGEAGTKDESQEEFKRRVKELESSLIEHWEQHEGTERSLVPVLKVPAKPTQREWLEHQVIHTPPKPWCKFCMMGRGNRRPHWTNVPDTEGREGKPNKFSIDYIYLNDDERKKDQPRMVMVDHNHGLVFSYSIPKKGAIGEAEWVPSRMIRDIDNMGYKDVTIQIKSDQEPAIVAVQEYIRLHRNSQTIPINSPVGESECNGRAENAIRRVKEKVRTLMAQLEDGIGEKIQKGANIIPWMVRWAGELISKYALGFDGKSPYERLRGERCKVPMAMFGEVVLYLPLKTAKSLQEEAQPKMSTGIWLGVIERTEESIIGTEKGIIKCRIVNRLPEDQRWDKQRVLSMRGSPWSPVPSAKGDHILVEIKGTGEPTTPEEETIDTQEEITFEEETNMPNAPSTSGCKGSGIIEFHIKKPMVQKYGYTDGCPACQKLKGISRDGRAPPGRLGVNHSVD